MAKFFTKTLFRLHLVLGILLGLYAFGIGLTGSILVYRDELTVWQHPELFAFINPVLLGWPRLLLQVVLLAAIVFAGRAP